MTERASAAKISDAMRRGRKRPEAAAMAAKAAPRARDPVSPMNTCAGLLLCARNPTQDPAMAAPKIDRAACTSHRSQSGTKKKKTQRNEATVGAKYSTVHESKQALWPQATPPQHPR